MTSAFIPAATRAGAPAYSPDTSASLSAADSSDAPSFDELCPEDHGRNDAERANTSTSSDEPVSEVSESEHPSDTVETSSDASSDAEEVTSEEDEDSETSEGPSPMESPTIVQSLLATLWETVPTTPAVAPVGNPAESAVTSPTPSTEATSVRSEGRPGTLADAETLTLAEAAALTVRRHGRARGLTDGEGAEAASTRRQPATAASVRATDKEATPTAGSVAVAARAKAAPMEDSSAQLAVARPLPVKNHAEKNAGQVTVPQVAQAGAGQNKFLNPDNQDLVSSTRIAGTRSALSGATMSSSTASTAQRRADSPALEAASPTAAGQAAWTETLSVDWKGWTNGGGERSSTAAQFSQLGEKLNHLGVVASPAAGSVARTATPAATFAAPAAPALPADTAEALAPIHSAIERLVLHGRDQLALTVRFEQGGSLSLRLAMNQGEIATQIQTDVPGLEAAIKSAWGDLAQDWNSRGWKLGQPEFTGGTATYHSREDATADGRSSGRQARQDPDEAPDFGGRAFSPARLKHAGAVALSGLDALRAAALARRGIHTWA